MNADIILAVGIGVCLGAIGIGVGIWLVVQAISSAFREIMGRNSTE